MTPHARGPRRPDHAAPAADDDSYELLDSGDARKLERFGPFVLARPCAQAVWRPRLDAPAWAAAHASFAREEGMRWFARIGLPDAWNVEVDGLRFELRRTDFGHVGLFPEQRALWRWIGERLRTAAERRPGPVSLLNLFAYSGGSTLAAAKAGAAVCHVDASKGMVSWASANAKLNGLAEAPVRWIVDDARKFLSREVKRSRRYEAIVLDPPTFGRGAKGEVYKIDEGLRETLDACAALLADDPAFLLLSSHTPGFTPVVLANLLGQTTAGRQGRIESGEMLLGGERDVLSLPSGAWARWSPK
jgi:23S rRNA (cytosine1962-C5)-methyltransferase